MPSITECGSPSSTERSMNAPGSPSSALQRMYLTSLLLLLGEAPLEAGRKAGAAAAAQTRGQDLVDDLLGGHLGERLDEGGVAVAGDVVLDAQRVDQARVAQHDLDLAVEELDVAHLGDRLLGAGGVAHEARHDAALEQVLLDDLGDVGHLDVLVEDAVGVDERHRSHGARAEATGLDDLDLVGQALLLQLLGERGADGQGAGGDATAARADEDVASELLHIRFLTLLESLSTTRSAARRPACRRRGAL